MATSRRQMVSTTLAMAGFAAGFSAHEEVAMALDEDVDTVVQQFYAAYNQVINGNPDPMLGLWSHEPYVSMMHAVGGYELGWERVEASWRQVSASISNGMMHFDQLQVHSSGDVALVVGVERGTITIDGGELDFDLRVTNIFERAGGEWKAIHHHADPLANSKE